MGLPVVNTASILGNNSMTFYRRQIHTGFCGSGHVSGPVTRHIPSLVPSVPIVLMGRHRLVCDGPRLWLPVEDCLDCSIDKSIQVSMEAAMSRGQ